MGLTLNSGSNAQVTDSALSLKVAGMAKNNQEQQGKMAMDLVQSAGQTAKVSAPTLSSGNHVNIKV